MRSVHHADRPVADVLGRVLGLRRGRFASTWSAGRAADSRRRRPSSGSKKYMSASPPPKPPRRAMPGSDVWTTLLGLGLGRDAHVAQRRFAELLDALLAAAARRRGAYRHLARHAAAWAPTSVRGLRGLAAEVSRRCRPRSTAVPTRRSTRRLASRSTPATPPRYRRPRRQSSADRAAGLAAS